MLHPKIEEIRADRLSGQDVECRKRFIEQQNSRLDDEGAGKADALAHAARQFARVGRFEAVETDEIDCGKGTAASFLLRNPQGLKPRFDVLQHGQPRK